MNNSNGPPGRLSPLEQLVMDYVWSHGASTADHVRGGIARPLKDSTIRTILRRLEEKGFVRHEVEGRTYVYRPTGRREHVAAGAVRQIIERLCGGSVEQLLVGMVESEVLDSQQLRRLAAKIADRKKRNTK